MKKLLPDLSKNIVCGNSLIGTDILDDQLFASEEERSQPNELRGRFPESNGGRGLRRPSSATRPILIRRI